MSASGNYQTFSCTFFGQLLTRYLYLIFIPLLVILVLKIRKSALNKRVLYIILFSLVLIISLYWTFMMWTSTHYATANK